ncbi:WD40 repeat domain-containing protein [Bremerella sp. JC770]|uniref:WD40 repeat domain-containing protein n=1 Tax=Bremerella sp. JC770 TaxID=3232137 RepID=UPI003458C33B
MRFTSSFLSFLLTGLLVLTAPALLLGQRPTAEELAEKWDRLAHRQRPLQISKANEFDLTGPAVSKFEISRDGRTLLVLDQEGALVFWDLRTGQQRSRIVPEQASPDAAIGIAPTGKTAVVGFPSGLIQVYAYNRDKPAINYDAYKTPVTRIQISSDDKRVIAVDGFGKSFEVDAFGKSKGFQFAATKDVPLNCFVAAGERLESWWKICVGEDNQVSDVFFDGKEKQEDNLELEPPQRIASSGDRFLAIGPKQLAWAILYYQGDQKYEAKFTKVDLAYPLRDAAYVYQKSQMWTLSDQQLEMRELTYGRVEKSVTLPADLPPEHTRLLPGDEAMVTITPEGHVTRWNAYVDTGSSLVDLSVSIANETARLRFDALEIIAKKWNDRTDHFVDGEHETPYSYLMSKVQQIAPRVPGHDIKPYKAFHDWIDNNPDNCQFTRIALFRLYLADGYRARGSGFASSVTEEGWKTFYENMNKSWEVAEPLFDQKEIPAEAFTCAIIAGKNLQWDRQIVNDYLREAFDKYPTYHRTFTEEAVARLPRWGGKPGETEYLARFTADKLGGVEGDILYAQLSQHVARFVGWDDIDTETRFSRERIMKGMLAMTKSSDNLFTINQTLLLAGKWDDEDAATIAAKRLVELDARPSKQVYPGKFKMIDKVFDEAGGGKPRW